MSRASFTVCPPGKYESSVVHMGSSGPSTRSWPACWLLGRGTTLSVTSGESKLRPSEFAYFLRIMSRTSSTRSSSAIWTSVAEAPGRRTHIFRRDIGRRTSGRDASTGLVGERAGSYWLVLKSRTCRNWLKLVESVVEALESTGRKETVRERGVGGGCGRIAGRMKAGGACVEVYVGASTGFVGGVGSSTVRAGKGFGSVSGEGVESVMPLIEGWSTPLSVAGVEELCALPWSDVLVMEKARRREGAEERTRASWEVGRGEEEGGGRVEVAGRIVAGVSRVVISVGDGKVLLSAAENETPDRNASLAACSLLFNVSPIYSMYQDQSRAQQSWDCSYIRGYMVWRGS